MNFFKRFQKLKVKEQTDKKRILSMTLISIGIACLLIGSSMAYLIFEAKGTTQTISAGTLQLSYTNESEAIILNNAVPQSDEQGLNNNVYSITLTNTSTIKSYYELSLNNNCTVGNSYTINGSSIKADVCIPNNYIKVAIKTNNDEDYTIKNGGNVILKGYLEAKENISFEMIIWLTEETPNDYQGQTETGTPRNVIYNGNFKIYTRQIIEDDYLESSGANAPVLASNMIPVYYDETNDVWKKADASNTNKTNLWYSYESSGEYKGRWANAVTVKDTNRQTYLNAEPGTTIPMDDITTMWVWIPRFNAVGNYETYNGTNDILNPGAFDITYTKLNEPSLDAFTFGDKELSGFWYGKFEISHTTLASSTTDDNLGCTNETCSNANEIIIKPNVKSLQYNRVSKFFYASRSMEQPNNSFGFVSSEVDTHMSKNNEWGAVAYLTQSIYGRCISSTNCPQMGINNNSSYLTGYGAPAKTAVDTNNGAYNTALGKGASTTGTIYGIYDMAGGSEEYIMRTVMQEVLMEDEQLEINAREIADAGFETLPNEKYYNVHLIALSQPIEDVDKTGMWYIGNKHYYVGKVGWFYRSGTGPSGLFEPEFMTLFIYANALYNDLYKFSRISSRFVITNE